MTFRKKNLDYEFREERKRCLEQEAREVEEEQREKLAEEED